MGYSHYLYYTVPELDAARFSLAAADFKSMVPIFEHLGFKIADGCGQGEPVITEKEIYFNGLEKCGHPKEHLGLVWPSENAQGIATPYSRKRQNAISGKWFAGLELSTRQCDGSCDYETFHIEQKPENRGEGLPISFCKTNYKPYDFAVNVCMIIVKHHLGDQVRIGSDGTLDQWRDAIQFCEHFLGYGSDFAFEDRPTPKPKAAPQVQTTQDNKIKVGDVFESHWGYDQTNIDYYKVTKISPTGKTCTIVRICSKKLEDTGFMSERVAPDPDKPYFDKVWNKTEAGEMPTYTEIIKEYRASVRKDRHDSQVWLRCGVLPGSGYLSVYKSPSIATHYA